MTICVALLLVLFLRLSPVMLYCIEQHGDNNGDDVSNSGNKNTRTQNNHACLHGKSGLAGGPVGH